MNKLKDIVHEHGLTSQKLPSVTHNSNFSVVGKMPSFSSR